MPDSDNGGIRVNRYKKIVQVGANSIVEDEPISVIQAKVLCNRQALIEVHRCLRCKYNAGLLNQYVMLCYRGDADPLPESLSKDPDYDGEVNDEERDVE